MKFLFLVISTFLLPGFTANAQTETPAFDPNTWYNLSPLFQPSKSLDVVNDGKNFNQVWLDKTQAASGQFWKITPLPGQPGYFRLTPQFQPAKSLDVLNDGKNYNQAWLDKSQDVSGQYWKITTIEGQPATFRLSPMFQPAKSLDVVNDGKNFNQVWLDNTQNVSGQYWVITPKSVPAPTPKPISPAPATPPVFDQNSWYNLSPLFQPAKSLDVLNDGKNFNQVWLDKTQAASGQFWKITPLPGQQGYFRLTPQFQPAKSLDVLNDGKNYNQAWLDKSQDISGQYWKITTIEGQPGTFRLSPMFQPAKSLDVVNDGKNFNQVWLDNSQNVSGQYWVITPKSIPAPTPKPITPAPATPPVFDQNSWYNLSPMFQPAKSLDVINDGKNFNQVWLDKTQAASGQFWKIAPLPGQQGYFRLTPQFQPAKSLDVLNDGKNFNQAWLDKSQDISGQYWKITTIEGQPGTFRLSPMFQPAKSLDVVNDGKNFNQVWLDKTQNVSGQYWVITPKSIPAPTPKPITPAPAATPVFDQNSWYNLSPMFQPAKSLDVLNDGKNFNQVWLDKTQAASGQFWKITPVPGQPGFFRLTPQFQPSKSLDVINDGKNYNQVWLDKTSLANGQLWKITAIQGQPGYFRLSPQYQPAKSLDVINDGKNFNQVWLDNTQNISGQYWKISPRANIVSPPANPIFYHPASGKFSLYLDGTLRPLADKSILTAIYGNSAEGLAKTNYTDYFKPPYPYGPFITNSGLYIDESTSKIYLLDNKVYRHIVNEEAMVYYQFNRNSVRNVFKPDKPQGTPIRKP